MGKTGTKFGVPSGTREYYRRRYLSEKEEYKRRAKAHRLAHPTRQRNMQLKSTYGISLEQYQRMLVEQKGVCIICKQPESTKRAGKTVALAVEHCHKTGKVRGLACRRCNSVLGFVEDNTLLLRALASYVEEHHGS